MNFENREIEKNILSMVMNSTSAAELTFLKLTKSDFLDVRHKVVFDTLLNMFKSKNVMTIENIIKQVIDNNAAKSVGDIEYLGEIYAEYISDEPIEDYLDILISSTTKRSMKDISKNIIKKIDENIPILDVIQEIEHQIINISATRGSNQFKTTIQEVPTILKKIELLSKNKKNITGISSGFSELDKITSGFQKGDLIILAARPSMGKTALALNFAFNAWKESKKTIAFFSVEMPSDQIILRFLSSIANEVNSQKIRTGQNLLKKDWDKLLKAADILKESKIKIDDTAGIKMVELQSKLRRLCREEDVGLVVVDYLQLLSTGNKNYESRQNEISLISRQLKILARDLNVPIVCLSQLSRAVEKREDKRPLMSDLRDSGAIEQDADIIMFLYREKYYLNHGEITEPSKEEVELIISKHRNGPIGKLRLQFDNTAGLFGDY